MSSQSKKQTFVFPWAIKTSLVPSFHFLPSQNRLKESLKQYGVLQPLHVASQTDESLELIDGTHRLALCQELGISLLPVFIHEGLSPKEMFMLALELNVWARSLNLADKALVIKTAAQIFDKEEIARFIYPIIEVKNEHQAKEIKNILELSRPILEYCLTKNFPFSVINKFLDFSSNDREIFFALLKELPFNQNKLLDVLTLLGDLSKKGKIEASLLLQEIMDDIQSEPLPQQIDLLRESLQKKRYPRYQKKLAEFQQALNAINLCSKTQVQPSPFFENDFIELKARLSSPKDCQDLAKNLLKNEWEHLFTIVEGRS